MSKVFNQINSMLSKVGAVISVLCFTLVLSTVQPTPVMANDVCAPQWYKKVAKKAKSVKNKAKSTAKKAASKSKSYAKKAASTAASKSKSYARTTSRRASKYAKKGASYAKKGAIATGKAAYKGATSKTGKAIGKFAKEEFKASELGKAAKGLTGKTARNFYKNPVKGVQKGIKSGIHKAKTDPGKYAKQFVKGRLESTKVGRAVSRGKTVAKYGKKIANTSAGKKATKATKSAAKKSAKKAKSAAKSVAKKFKKLF